MRSRTHHIYAPIIYQNYRMIQTFKRISEFSMKKNYDIIKQYSNININNNKLFVTLYCTKITL